jgi:hypothetical protein
MPIIMNIYEHSHAEVCLAFQAYFLGISGNENQTYMTNTYVYSYLTHLYQRLSTLHLTKSMQVERAPGDALTLCVTPPRCIFFKHCLCKKSLAGYLHIFWLGQGWRDVVAIFRTDKHHLSLRIFSATIVNKRDVHHSTGCIISAGSVGLTTREPSK